ncbi:MAG: hypothetical protein NT027_18590, partial [Proteobacteria bacterium]|nr:hypothetical protein [Pseudomonadota bacterium]
MTTVKKIELSHVVVSRGISRPQDIIWQQDLLVIVKSQTNEVDCGADTLCLVLDPLEKKCRLHFLGRSAEYSLEDYFGFMRFELDESMFHDLVHMPEKNLVFLVQKADRSDFETYQMITSQLRNSDEVVIFVGQAYWQNDFWYSSPSGVFRSKSGWTHFAPVGNPVALRVTLSNYVSQDDNLRNVDPELFQGRLSDDLGLALYHSVLGRHDNLFLEIDDTLQDAIIFCLARKAFPNKQLFAVLRFPISPEWRLFLSHCGAFL